MARRLPHSITSWNYMYRTLTTALWELTLDQHHTGLRQVEVDWQQLYGDTLVWGKLKWTDNSSMGTHRLDQHHTGLRQVEVDWQRLYGVTHWFEAGWSGLTTALWGHTLVWGRLKWTDNGYMWTHTGLRQVEVDWQRLYGVTHWFEAGWSGLTTALWGHTLVWGRLKWTDNSSMGTHTGLRQVEVAWQQLYGDTHTVSTSYWVKVV